MNTYVAFNKSHVNLKLWITLVMMMMTVMSSCLDSKNLDKSELINMVLRLRKEVASITEDFKKIMNLGFYHLERSQYMNLQYGRRDTVEINWYPR